MVVYERPASIPRTEPLMTTTLQRPTFRSFQHEPGDALFLPVDVVTLMIRFAEMSQASGIATEHLRVSALVSTPTFAPGSSIRGLAPDPDFAWYPLLWLPQRFALARGESLDHQMVRIALEMSQSGMYDTVTGEWFDVMAHLGLSVEDTDDLDRIQAWLSGGSDDLLDSFDLDDLLAVREDIDWAFDSATEMLASLTVISMSRASASLGELLEDAMNTTDQMFIADPTRRVDVATTAAVGAVAFLGSRVEGYAADLEDLRDAISRSTPEGLSQEGSAAMILLNVLNSIHEDTADVENELAEQFIAAYGSTPAQEDLLGEGPDEDEVLQIEAGGKEVRQIETS